VSPGSGGYSTIFGIGMSLSSLEKLAIKRTTTKFGSKYITNLGVHVAIMADHNLDIEAHKKLAAFKSYFTFHLL
jgi:hypothetical protein